MNPEAVPETGSYGGNGYVYVAGLRGINVGGKNENALPMRDLVALFAFAGCDGVKTSLPIRVPCPASARAVASAVTNALSSVAAGRNQHDSTAILPTKEQRRRPGAISVVGGCVEIASLGVRL